MTPLDLQLYMFFVTVLAGVILGLSFDVYRVLRGVLKPRGIVASLGDVVFWVFAAALTVSAVFYSNWGELRLYVFLGFAVGLALYYALASRLVIRITAWNFKLVRRVFAAIVGLLMRVFGYPARAVFRAAVYTARVARRAFKGLRPRWRWRFSPAKLARVLPLRFFFRK